MKKHALRAFLFTFSAVLVSAVPSLEDQSSPIVAMAERGALFAVTEPPIYVERKVRCGDVAHDAGDANRSRCRRGSRTEHRSSSRAPAPEAPRSRSVARSR